MQSVRGALVGEPRIITYPAAMPNSCKEVAEWLGISTFEYHLLPSAALIGIGLGLIGLCQPPIRFSARVGLVGIAGAGLAFSCGA